METLEKKLENVEYSLRAVQAGHEISVASYRARIATLREQIAAEKAAAEKADPGMAIAKEIVTQDGNTITFLDGKSSFNFEMVDRPGVALPILRAIFAARFNAEIARARQEGRIAMRDECVKVCEEEAADGVGQGAAAIRYATAKLKELK